MSETGTMVFIRIIARDGSEMWRRFQFIEDDQQIAAASAAEMMRREDVREIVTVKAEDLTYWSHELKVAVI